MKREFLDGTVFASLAEAQAALDGWVKEYNTRTASTRASATAPRRSASPWPGPSPSSRRAPAQQPATEIAPRLIRRVRSNGKVSLLNFDYHVGRFFAGQSVELVCRDGLIEVFFDSALVATHARRHRPEHDDRVERHALAATPARPKTDHVVVRKVDGSGSVSFAGADYRVGNAHKRHQVEVAVVGDTVQIWGEGKLLRTHPVKHDRRKEHGAFANPGGRPDRINAA